MNSEIEETVKNCSLCADFQKKPPDGPLKPTPFAEAGSDLFDSEGKN